MTSSSESWLSLLETAQSKLDDQECKAKATISDEASFREEFKSLCLRRKVHDPVQFSTPLVDSFACIFAFAEDVAKGLPGLGQDRLKTIIWYSSFAIIKFGTRGKSKVHTLVDLIVKLNIAVSPFQLDNTLYPEDLGIQSQLQEFFGAYLESYIWVARYINKNGQDSVSQLLNIALDKHLEQRNGKFEESKRQYEDSVKEETTKQEHLHRRRLRGSQPLALPSRLSLRSNRNPYNTEDIDVSFVTLKQIGDGYNTRVYEVQETTTQKVYACKRIYFTQTSNTELERKAQAEVDIMGQLNHDHIVSVLFDIKTQDCHSIFMTPVAEHDLEQYLQHCERQSYPIKLVDAIFRWFGTLLSALEYAHQRRIRHRDIKPSNILIKEGRPYLADFGLAVDFTAQAMSSTQSTYVRGTPLYFAPENNPRESHGRQADVFALGCVYSEMLTVANKLQLDSFKTYRYTDVDNICGPYAFRASLDKVRRWLKEEIPQSGPYNDRLVTTILPMIEEEPAKRYSALQGLQALKFESAFFWLV